MFVGVLSLLARAVFDPFYIVIVLLPWMGLLVKMAL